MKEIKEQIQGCIFSYGSMIVIRCLQFFEEMEEYEFLQVVKNEIEKLPGNPPTKYDPANWEGDYLQAFNSFGLPGDIAIANTHKYIILCTAELMSICLTHRNLSNENQA